MKMLVILSREWNTMEFFQARMAMAMGPWLITKLDLNQVAQNPESVSMEQVRDWSSTEICNNANVSNTDVVIMIKRGTHIHKVAEVKHEEVVLDGFVGKISGKKYLDENRDYLYLLMSLNLSIMSMVFRMR